MKKFFVFLIVAVMTVLTAVAFVGCGENVGTADNSSVTGETSASGNSSVVEVSSGDTADSSISVDVSDSAFDDSSAQYETEKKTFRYTSYLPDEVYESGGITRQDLLSIAYYANDGITEKNKDQYPEDFAPNPKDPKALDKKTIAALEKSTNDYFDEKYDYNAADYHFYGFLGQYGEYLAAKLHDGGTWAATYDYVVDGIHFTFPYLGNIELFLFKVEEADETDEVAGSELQTEKGKLYYLYEIYEIGEITKQDLLSIAYYVNGGIREDNEGRYPANFVPAPKDPEELDETTKSTIEIAFRYPMGWNARFSAYYGRYGEYLAVSLNNGSRGHRGYSYDYAIDGVIFEFVNCAVDVYLYKIDGTGDEGVDPTEKELKTEEVEFYYLKEVYESGEITRQDLLSIAYYANDGITEANQAQYPSGFVPTPKNPQELSEKTITAIENSLSVYLSEGDNDEVSAHFYGYHGQYGDYLVVSLSDSRGAWTWVYDYVVDGVHFRFPTSIVELYLIKL